MSSPPSSSSSLSSFHHQMVSIPSLLCWMMVGVVLTSSSSSSCQFVQAATTTGSSHLYHHHHYHHQPHHGPKSSLKITTSTAKTTTMMRSVVSSVSMKVPRGGSTTNYNEEEEDNDFDENIINVDDDDDDDEEEEQMFDITEHPDFDALQKYRMKQQILLQLRATYLSEALAKRGVPVTTLLDVQSQESSSVRKPVDWDCVLSPEENPYECIYTFNSEPGTKLVGPLGGDKWMSLRALNHLRRYDPNKVDGMWHDSYSILNSWFTTESEYSMVQHVGTTGFILNAILPEGRLKMLLAMTIIFMTVLFLPIIEYIVNRFLVSSLVWSQWPKWGRYVHAALPLKLFIGQMTLKAISFAFDKLASVVKEKLVELESEIWEKKMPLTIGVEDSEEKEEIGNVNDDVLDLDGDEEEEG